MKHEVMILWDEGECISAEYGFSFEDICMYCVALHSWFIFLVAFLRQYVFCILLLPHQFWF